MHEYRHDQESDRTVQVSDAQAHPCAEAEVGGIVEFESISGRSFGVFLGFPQDAGSSLTGSYVLAGLLGIGVPVLMTPHGACPVEARMIVDWNPACPVCGQRGQWWWVMECQIQCAVCCPPVHQNWDLLWKDILRIVAMVSPHHPQADQFRAALAGCDAAYLAGNWGQFQKYGLQLSLLAIRQAAHSSTS